jgi:hypothetical protein
MGRACGVHAGEYWLLVGIPDRKRPLKVSSEQWGIIIQGRKCMCNVTMRRVRAAIVAVGK